MRKEIVAVSFLLFVAIALGFLSSTTMRNVYADPSDPAGAPAQTHADSPQPVGMHAPANDALLTDDALLVPQGVPASGFDAEQVIVEQVIGMPQGQPAVDS